MSGCSFIVQVWNEQSSIQEQHWASLLVVLCDLSHYKTAEVTVWDIPFTSKLYALHSELSEAWSVMSGIIFIACSNIGFDWWPTAIYQIGCNSNSEEQRSSIFILPTAGSVCCSQESSGSRRDIHMDIHRTIHIVISRLHNLHIYYKLQKTLFNNDLVYLRSCPNFNSLSSNVIALHETHVVCVFTSKKSPNCKLKQPSIVQKSFLDFLLGRLPF